ncbi:MAG: DNA replication/repair protein RecF [Deltaproteobacteria bacterium]|nr:DNA replication/repair protein RecF [Deltaproteobacteria bacterium]
MSGRLLEHRVRDFRNLARVEVELCEGLNVLLGANGQGKTSFLESIYFLSTQRALRGSRLVELVRIGAERSEIQAKVVGELTSHLTLKVQAGRRQALIGEKAERSLSRWSSLLPVIAFTPDDLAVAKGGPAERRQWLDRAVFARRPSHLEAIRRYRRAVASRNRLLRDAKPGLEHALASFDPVVAQAGAEVIQGRRQVTDELTLPMVRILETIVGTKVEAAMVYRSTAEEGQEPSRAAAELEGRLMEALRRHRAEDRARRRTCVGPHVDEIELSLHGRPLRTYGSQGQQRSVVLALKIAEIENLQERAGVTPLLLLDDISSELDPERNAHLLDYLQRFPGQALLTTTDLSHLSPARLSGARIFQVEEGRVEPRAEGGNPS